MLGAPSRVTLAALAGVFQLSCIAGSPDPVRAQTGDRCESPVVIHSLPFVTIASTTGLTDDYVPRPGQCGLPNPTVGQGPDAVYLFQSFAAQPESVVFQVEPRSWDATLYAWIQDCSSGPCAALSNVGGPGQAESFTIEVQPFVPYYIIVDGVSGASGEYFCAVHFARETLCETIDSPLLALARNQKAGAGLVWKATTSPTHTIFAPSACRREYRVPWPRVGAGGAALWGAFARAEMLNERAVGVPSYAVARIQLIGNYTLHCKPQDVGAVLCTASFNTNGRQLAITEKPGGLAFSYLSTRILFQPFFLPAWPDRPLACASVPASPEDKCSIVEPWNVSSGVVPEFVKCNTPYFVDFLLEAYAERWGTGFARAQNHRLDVDLQCATCLPSDHAPLRLERREVSLNIEEARITRTYRVQPQSVVVPPGFAAAFVSVDSTQTPVGLDASAGFGFGSKLYLTKGVSMAPEFSDSTPPDTSALLTYEGGTLASFPGTRLRAPSDLAFDEPGNFGHRLHAAVADSFDAQTGGPLAGHGAVVSVDSMGNVTPLVGDLAGPSALAFAPVAPWDGNLYATEIAVGNILRITPGGAVSTFATGLTLPTDAEFASGGFGGDFYVTEADSLWPDSLPHVNAGRIVRYASNGARSTLASALHLPTSLVHTTGGLFGDYLYVALGDELDGASVPIPNTGRLVRVDPLGNVTTFADGLEQPVGVAFSAPGELDVAVAGGFVRITSSSVGVDPSTAPGEAALSLEGSPNPFHAEIQIRLRAPRTGHYRVEVFDLAGRHVITVLDRELDPGPHEFTWNGTDQEGRRLASGMYWLHATASRGGTATRRVALLR